MSYRSAEIGAFLALSMVAGACSPQPDRVPPPVVVKATTAPAVLPPKYIATSTARPSELDLKRSTSLAVVVFDNKNTALIGPNAEPRYYNGGFDPFSDNRIDYPERLVTSETRVTSSPIKLKVHNSTVTVDAQLYKIGDGSPQAEQYMQESFTFVVNYYKGVLDKAFNIQNLTPEGREAIKLINQSGGVAKYLESKLAGFSKSNVVSIWNQVIPDGDGSPYGVTLPPPKSNTTFPTAEPIRKIIVQKITHDTLGKPLIDLIILMGADDEIVQNPWFVRFSEGAGSCLYNPKTKQFSAAIIPAKTHWYSPSIPELQKDDVTIRSAWVNEFANIVAEGLDPSVQALMYAQIEKEAGVNQARYAQAQKDHPNVRNEFASTMAMIEYQKTVLAAHK